jgi:hypothetical protein
MTDSTFEQDPPFRTVLLEVWQEACRHIEIPESCGTIARLLGRHLPLEFLLVRRLDAASDSCPVDTIPWTVHPSELRGDSRGTCRFAIVRA